MLSFALLLATASLALAEEAAAPPAEPPDSLMGEYFGTFTPAGGQPVKAEGRVIAEGNGEYRAVITCKTADDAKAVRLELTGKAEDKKVTLAGKAGDVEWKGTCTGQETLLAESKDGKFEGKWTVRKSPTLGAKPPAGAIVLLPFEEGKAPSVDEWEQKPWVPLPDGSLMVRGGDIHTKRSFGNVKLHVEFRIPFMPTARGQGRGNSGVYLQSRYEVQVLDSFGLALKDNECGGIYSVGPAKAYAPLPPGQWQTYDIEFKAPEVQDEKMVKPARITVAFNGIKVHDDQPIDHTTTSGDGGPPQAKAPLKLQDHGNPVRYRNIWIIEQKD
jgi:hypothetical protein